MRALMLLAVLGLGLTPSAAATPAPPFALVVSELDEDATLLSWSPVAGAASYVVYHGLTEERLVPIGVTARPFFLDDRPLEGVYRVLPSGSQAESDTSSGGSCVHKHGSDVSVSTSCVDS